jgi:hypothetical protein
MAYGWNHIQNRRRSPEMSQKDSLMVLFLIANHPVKGQKVSKISKKPTMPGYVHLRAANFLRDNYEESLLGRSKARLESWWDECFWSSLAP